MTTDFDRVRSSLQFNGDQGMGGGFFEGLNGLLFGDDSSGDDLLTRSRLTPAEAKASAVVMSGAIRLSERPKKLPKNAVDWWGMSDGERLVRLNAALSISVDGAGRQDAVAAITGNVAMRRQGVKDGLDRLRDMSA